MIDKRLFRLTSNEVRQRAIDAIWGAPDGAQVVLSEPTRNLEQSARFHSVCGELAKYGPEWAGKRRTATEWKLLCISGHAAATQEGAEVVRGLEGELINLRESTALMSKKRASSLIEYSEALLAHHKEEA